MVHQIDIHKSLLLYEGDNGPGKHEEEIILSVINGKREQKKREREREKKIFKASERNNDD